MSRFFCLPQEVEENQIVIEQKDEVHHIVDVMRQKKGDTVVVFDGSGRQYRGKILDLSQHRITINIISKLTVEDSGVTLCLACAIPKKAKFDYIVQKVTELGVDEIIPLITERTVAKPDKKDFLDKTKRWQKIAIEAAKQSGSVSIPKIKEPLKFKEALSLVKDYDLAIIPHLAEERKELSELDLTHKKSAIIFIGPEGDFTFQEINQAKYSGCLAVSLGRNVLKVDTAAIFSVGILSWLLKKI